MGSYVPRLAHGVLHQPLGEHCEHCPVLGSLDHDQTRLHSRNVNYREARSFSRIAFCFLLWEVEAERCCCVCKGSPGSARCSRIYLPCFGSSRNRKRTDEQSIIAGEDFPFILHPHACTGSLTSIESNP